MVKRMQVTDDTTKECKLQNENMAKKLTEIQGELTDANKKYALKCRAFLRLCLDLPTAMYCIDLHVNQQVGGACGTLATCLSVYEILNK